MNQQIYSASNSTCPQANPFKKVSALIQAKPAEGATGKKWTMKHGTQGQVGKMHPCIIWSAEHPCQTHEYVFTYGLYIRYVAFGVQDIQPKRIFVCRYTYIYRVEVICSRCICAHMLM